MLGPWYDTTGCETYIRSIETKSTSQLMMRRTGFFLTKQILLSIENKSHDATGGAGKQIRFSEHQRDKKNNQQFKLKETCTQK